MKTKVAVFFGICATILLLHKVNTAMSNPSLIDARLNKIVHIIYEDLTIEVHEKYSKIHGYFKFRQSVGKSTRGQGFILLPILKHKNSLISDFYDFTDPEIRCGKKTLKRSDPIESEHLNVYVRRYTDDFKLVFSMFQNDMSCDKSETYYISYKQLNVDVNGTATAIYIPLLDKSVRSSEKIKIKVVGNGSIKPFIANKAYPQTTSDVIEITPKSGIPIVIGYGNSKKYKLKPYAY